MNGQGRAVRNLLYNLVRRDLTVRYKSTLLGFFWSFIKPLALTAVFYVVFDKIIEVPLAEKNIPLALHLLTGMLAWTFFSGACAEGMNVFLANANLIKKVRLPLYVFPLAAVCSHMVHFILAFLVLVALLIIAGLTPSWEFVLVLPIMALQFLLTLAVVLALSALNVFYRDVSSIWEVLTTAWFYATPIIYPVSLALEKMAPHGRWMEWLYLANPLTPIILAYRRVLLYAALDEPVLEMSSDAKLLGSLLVCALITGVLLALSWRIFSSLSKLFADEL